MCFVVMSDLSGPDVIGSILGSSDYYSLFSISREDVFDPEHVRRTYKRLALSVHPDKHSGSLEAERAFKKLSRAYQVLTDQGLKQVYDTFGCETDNVDDSVEDIANQAKSMFPGMDSGMATQLLAMMSGYTGEGPSRVTKMTIEEIEVFLRNSQKHFPSFGWLLVWPIAYWLFW